MENIKSLWINLGITYLYSHGASCSVALNKLALFYNLELSDYNWF